jgi:hypothetical protein
VTALVIRRWWTLAEKDLVHLPTAAMTRWRIAPAPPSSCRPRPRTGTLASRTPALPRRRTPYLDCRGLRCEGSSRSTCRLGRPIGSGGGPASRRVMSRS